MSTPASTTPADQASALELRRDELSGGERQRVALRDGRSHWQGRPAELNQATLRDVYGAELKRLDLAGVTQA